MMKKHFSLFFLCLFYTLHLSASEIPQSINAKYQVIKDLQGEWLKIDRNNKYVPFISDEFSSTPAIGIMLNLTRYSGNSMLCYIPSRSSVLIDQQIVAYYEKGKYVRFDIDSLHRIYNSEQILVSVYQPHQAFEKLKFLIVSNAPEAFTGLKNPSLKREGSALEDFFIVVLLIMLISYAFQINQYPRTFRYLYDFRKVFSLKMREDNPRIRLINEAHIAFLIHHCLLVSFLLLLLISSHSLVDLSLIIDQPHSFSEFIFTWLKLSFFIFLIIWLKYITVMMLGTLFKLRNLKYIHVFDFIRMSLIFWCGLFTVMILIFSGITMSDPRYVNLLVYVFIAFAVARIFILYYRLFAGTSFRNMYLFSYICTLEVIPLLVGLELFIG